MVSGTRRRPKKVLTPWNGEKRKYDCIVSFFNDLVSERKGNLQPGLENYLKIFLGDLTKGEVGSRVHVLCLTDDHFKDNFSDAIEQFPAFLSFVGDCSNTYSMSIRSNDYGLVANFRGGNVARISRPDLLGLVSRKDLVYKLKDGGRKEVLVEAGRYFVKHAR